MRGSYKTETENYKKEDWRGGKHWGRASWKAVAIFWEKEDVVRMSGVESGERREREEALISARSFSSLQFLLPALLQKTLSETGTTDCLNIPWPPLPLYLCYHWKWQVPSCCLPTGPSKGRDEALTLTWIPNVQLWGRINLSQLKQLQHTETGEKLKVWKTKLKRVVHFSLLTWDHLGYTNHLKI